MPAEIKEQVDKLVETTKKNFNLQERLKNRGLRRGSITLFMDDDKGAELGWVRDIEDAFGNVTSKETVGVLGLLALAEDARGAEGVTPAGLKKLDARVAELEKQRDELIAELTKTALVIQLRAVPPIVQKDTRRKARATLGITDKSIPEDKAEEFNVAQTAHLMTVMTQSVTDNSTGDVNDSLAFEDAIALMDYLSAQQFKRLDRIMGELQFTDAISESIESQEDFS